MATPTGTVNLNKNGFSLGVITLDGSGKGSLTYTTNSGDVPQDTISASYGGDSTHNPSSASCIEVVNPAIVNTTTTVTTTPNPAIAGQDVTVNVTVS